MPGGLGVHAEEILREEHILLAVPVKVGNADAERRRELRLDRQRARLEVIATVQEHHRIGSCGLKFHALVSEDVLHTRAAIRSARLKFFLHKRQRHGHRIQVAPGNNFF